VLAELWKQGFGQITLTNLPSDSSTVAAIGHASADNGYRYFARTAYVCAQVSLSQLERRTHDNTPVLPRRKMVRRFLSAMGREGPVRLDHARSWGEIERVLPQFVQSHIGRFLITGRISNLARPERRIFLAELAKLLSECGWVTLTRMVSGTNSIAWNYGFQFEDTWFWYQPTFDSDLERYSPGFCLLTKLIEEAAGNPIFRIVDLGLGAEEYKDRFANQTRETLYVTLRSSATQHSREVLRYHAGRIIHSSPKIEAVVRALAGRLQRLTQSVRRDGARATLGMLAKRFGESLLSETEVLFFEATESQRLAPDPAELVPLDLNRLASAASHYVDDKSTLAYLLRGASRLRDGIAEGFGLVDSDGRTILHLAWVTVFDGFFLSELNAKVDAPGADCVMLFDCWTPIAARGRGFYGRTVELVANLVRRRGKRPWIFSASANRASVRGLEKTGFEYRYSLVRKRVLGWQRIKGKGARLDEISASEVSARVS